MLIFGLTGSIGMGKSTVARMIAARSVPVLDADAVVHDLYSGAAVEPLARRFPFALADGAIDRTLLTAHLKAHPGDLADLEAIVHPLVRNAQRDFLHSQAALDVPVVCLEIPLLFETGGDARVDRVVVVSAPEPVQRERVMAREGMTKEKFALIQARQMPDEEKRRRADYVVDTGCTKEETEQQIAHILDDLSGLQGSVYAQRWA